MMKPVRTFILGFVLVAILLLAMLVVRARQDADIQVATLMGTYTAQFQAIGNNPLTYQPLTLTAHR